jgi:hypothetical protein
MKPWHLLGRGGWRGCAHEAICVCKWTLGRVKVSNWRAKSIVVMDTVHLIVVPPQLANGAGQFGRWMPIWNNRDCHFNALKRVCSRIGWQGVSFQSANVRRAFHVYLSQRAAGFGYPAARHGILRRSTDVDGH